jgi:hypothetical protein
MARKRRRPLTADEISGQQGTVLPNRVALSLVLGSVAAAAGLLGAASAASQQAAPAAGAEAEQVAEVVQES